MKLSKNDIEFIEENIPNGEDLIKTKDIDEILRKVSSVMLMKGFDISDEINDFGRKAEKVYDSIYYNN